MTEVALVALAVAHPVAAILTVLAPFLWRAGGPRAGARAAYAAAWLLIAAWLVTGYQGGVRADEQGTGGNIFETSGWLVLAVVAAVLSVVLSRRARPVPSS
ncbi:hypothetical protein DQ244_04675 [Blastococcus sp. TBT05-19]|uniref:hypothetical protein n=1 Tax=Blastococcus sp. TBT05-19 TaxID=2250581 RepID=UPI000DE83C5D|nr:hypothetical protein [Blastococcus sp. TBT05-19]RBY94590.1 hypothetical protein DQ244_04675 [Blastococcus sp. TBT05-19]